MLRVATVLAAAAVAAAAVSSDSDPSYDHQTQPYVPDHTPVTTTGKLNLRAFFSPDWSVATYIELIQSALPGTTLYIGAPGFDSWNFCTYTVDDDFYGQCDGCTVEKQAAETFPVFPAILNAVHQRGVTVNILTNNYNTPTCRGYIAPLDFLSLNGVNIKYYDSTTFMHAKYVHVNGNTTSVSSVNFSWTSFNKNREAGIIMSGKDAAPLMDMMHAVFEDDFAQATPYVVNQTYSSEEMAVITSKKAYPVVAPPKQTFPNNYVTPPPVPLPGTSTVTAFASPDSSLKTLLADVEGASTSFQLYMYQITDPTLCTLMQKLSARGVNVTLMVSAKIYDASDSASAHACYDQLLEGGMSVRLSPAYYTYSHQKYWIVDGVRMGLSTGNWSPTDYPPVQTAAGNYPAYGSPGWQRVNRDFNLLVEDSAALVSIFATTLAEDHARGSWYSSGTSLYRPA